jgi:hypothetical protein
MGKYTSLGILLVCGWAVACLAWVVIERNGWAPEDAWNIVGWVLVGPVAVVQSGLILFVIGQRIVELVKGMGRRS